MTRLKFAMTVGMILAVSAFSASIVTAADAILINFSSSQCTHCRAMEPTLAQLANSGTPVRHVNVASEPDLARRFGVRKTPTFVVVSGGKEVTRLVGTHTLAELQKAIAVDPSGPLIPTGARAESFDAEAPKTRLAPVGSLTEPETLTSAAAAGAAAPRSEAMPSLSLAEAVERAEAATVRLKVYDGQGYGTGTGTIIDTHDDEALVLTCGHLFRETEGQGKIEVELFVGGETRTVAGQVIDYDAESRDIALVAIRPGFPVQAVKLVAADDVVRTGQSAFSFGCDHGADPSRRDTRITAVNKYDQHLKVSNLEIAGAPVNGRSGGGLFDDRGRLIGVCNAADYKVDVGIYAGPGSIRWQLDRVDLAHLYQQNESPAGPPVDRIASTAGVAAAVPVSAQTASLSANQPPSNQTLATQTLATQTLATQTLATQAELSQPLTTASTQEVIVIVRDRNQPATSQVMTLDNPSTDLMQMIQQQAR